MNCSAASDMQHPETTVILDHYVPVRPTPTEPVPWTSTAPFPHTQMRPGTTRHLELIREQLRIEDARTDYEIRHIIDHGLSGLELWPPDTLAQHEREFPVPKYDPQRKTKVYMKKELEDFILNEDVPLIQRVAALLDRCRIMDHVYSRFDLIEKGKAMLHELKFKVSGDKDWKRILDLEFLIERRASQGHTKDTMDPRSWKHAFDIPLAPFIKEQLVEEMRLDGYDLDVQFSRVFGLESSPRVKNGEPAIHWEGWDPSGPVDWGWFRLNKMASGSKDLLNGHTPMSISTQHSATSEDSSDEEELGRHLPSDLRDDKSDDGESENDLDDADNSEASVVIEQQRQASSGVSEASQARESSSEIEFIGSHAIQPRKSSFDETNEVEEDESQLSAVEDYSIEEEEEAEQEAEAEAEEEEEEEEILEEGEGEGEGEAERVDDDDEDSEDEDGSDEHKDEKEGIQDDDESTEENDEKYEEIYEGNDEDLESTVDEDDAEVTERESDEQSETESDDVEVVEEHRSEVKGLEEQQRVHSSLNAIIRAQAIVAASEGEEPTEPETNDEDGDDTERGGTEETSNDLSERNHTVTHQRIILVEEISYTGQVERKNSQAEDFDGTDIDPQRRQSSPVSSIKITSEASSPLSSLDSEHIAMLDPSLEASASKHAVSFSDLAKRAMERAGVAQSLRASDTSGLSSPPSSLSSLVQEEKEELPYDGHPEKMKVEDGANIDPALFVASDAAGGTIGFQHDLHSALEVDARQMQDIEIPETTHFSNNSQEQEKGGYEYNYSTEDA
ncbi:uncharacterized protein PV09_05278 [Verruconis gallopava]|uniref:Uncharacterized protein n=1 Tax=Verruconis gallopava TaxID=253628 RepID=A0A0D2A9X3_9PEZI|nr:uncharacterized protein PV09_05278 [Verruconis gallopava]KIW03513.1 hypothetical protein PV09_05278 [Verruconis gallopava]